MKRGQISKILRGLGLIYFTDWLRFYIEKNKNKADNKTFKQNHPDVILPPDYLIYESFQINYRKYYTDSIETAKWLTNHFKKYIELKDVKVLDWGCGPARIIRHLPSIMGDSCEYYGTDYNKRTIEWCSNNIKGISFNENTLAASLPYDDNSIDIIYGISIFTHLSEQLHYDWYNELKRVLKTGGIMFLTSHGDNFKVKLTDSELRNYNDDKIIIRGMVKEGHRTFTAFHPKAFMQKLFSTVEVLEHIEIPYKENQMPQQDIWIIKKK